MQVADLDAAATHEKTLATYAPLKASLKPKNGFAFVYHVKEVNSRNAQQVTVTCVCCNQSFCSTGSSQPAPHPPHEEDGLHGAGYQLERRGQPQRH